MPQSQLLVDKVPQKISDSGVKQDIPKIENKESEVTNLVEFSTEKIKVIFDEQKAAIKEVFFKGYQSSNLLLGNGLRINNQLNFRKDNASADKISFIYNDKEKEIIKRFIFSNSNYSMGLEIFIKNLSNVELSVDLPIILGTLDFSKNDLVSRYQDWTISQSDKLLHPQPLKEKTFNPFNFLGLRDRYFCIITQPLSNDNTAFIRKVDTKKSELILDLKSFVVVPQGTWQRKLLVYLGPQQAKFINAVHPDWASIVHYGTFDFISQMLLVTLDILYGIVKNWGWAIILMSVAIYFLLYPLTLKQMRSMREMQALQPRIEELRKAYKDNSQRLNKEIMELYREHKVNPLGGCLPLILQMPIFFALYQALMRSVMLKGARFLWIKDLSEPDRLFILPTAVPILGNEINLLPTLMMAGMFFQQKLSLTTNATGSNEQQKLMLILFPLLFGFIFYHMPAGLVLYWFVNNVLMLFNQLKVNKFM